MLKRQKVLLSILESTKESISRIKLVKLAFLLSQDQSLKAAVNFYDFVPYRYGPFSFALYREMESLISSDLITQNDHSFKASPIRDNDISHITQELKGSLRLTIDQTIANFGSMDQSDLLKFIYKKYPWYAVLSEMHEYKPQKLPKPKNAPIAIYSIGYEGLSVDAFFNKLLKSGIKAVIDVRANPISRKYGFAKKSLKEIASKLNIGYFHFPEVGIASNKRADLCDFESYQKLLNEYESDFLPTRKSSFLQILKPILKQPSALLCYENNVRCCHRSRLADALAKESKLKVFHI